MSELSDLMALVPTEALGSRRCQGRRSQGLHEVCRGQEGMVRRGRIKEQRQRRYSPQGGVNHEGKGPKAEPEQVLEKLSVVVKDWLVTRSIWSIGRPCGLVLRKPNNGVVGDISHHVFPSMCSHFRVHSSSLCTSDARWEVKRTFSKAIS